MTEIVNATSSGLRATIREVAYADPHVTGGGDGFLAQLHELERLAADYYDGAAGVTRKRTSAIDRANPATAKLLADYPSFGDWLGTVPSAAALDPLYDPTSTVLPNGAVIDEGLRRWFCDVPDAIGIRSRAFVLQEVLTTHATTSPARQQWLSLACGAAQPLIGAMVALRDAGHPLPRATLADIDTSALALASSYAAREGLQDDVRTTRRNVLRRGGFDGSRALLPGRRPAPWPGAFDAVDAVGLLEYLRPEDWTYTYRGVVRSRRTLAGAVTFLRNAFACVKPGGVLVVGNMLDSHPQLGFTLDVVQWPHIQPRSVSRMLELFEDAGLQGQVDVHLPTDGVYAVYVVTKPPA